MWRSVKRELSINRASLWQTMLILAGACVVGEIVMACIFHFTSDAPEFVPMGFIFTAMTACICGILFPAYYFSCGYEQALTLGCTRKSFLVGELALSAVHILLLMAEAALAMLADWGFYRLFYPTAFAAIRWDGFAPDVTWLGIVLLIVAALVCAGLFLGASLQRWGRRAAWALWGIYMVFVFFSGPLTQIGKTAAAQASPLGAAVRAVDGVLALLPLNSYLILGGVLLLALGAAGAEMLLRGSVRRAQ